ncbi:MAG: hypothetical protein K6E98_01350 [Lachnospiraceae bacterium]|nr:hypothetical protein [Lachnospiraceae bacterium]
MVVLLSRLAYACRLVFVRLFMPVLVWTFFMIQTGCGHGFLFFGTTYPFAV